MYPSRILRSSTKSFPIGVHGARIPAIGLGTWQSPKGEVRAAVSSAIAAGYRHIDCAAIYGNEEEVAEGIKDSGVSRDELWITSKLWNSEHSPERVESALDASLRRLDTSFLDLYLIHWPVAFAGKTPDGKQLIDTELTNNPLPTWRALENLVEKGKLRHIGISNFTSAKAQSLYDRATIKPAVNQVELNLGCAQPELVAWAQKAGVLLEAYSPLGSTGARYRDDPVVKEIADAHGCDPANVLISWQVERGAVVLPKSVTPARIESNFKDIPLTSSEVGRLEKRAREVPFSRTVNPGGWGKIFDDKLSKM